MNSSRRVGGLSVAVLAASLWGHLAVSARNTHFDVPAGTAHETLAEFGQQAHLTILYVSQATGWVAAPAVSGKYGPFEAQRSLLAGSGLTFGLVDLATVAGGQRSVAAAPASPKRCLAPSSSWWSPQLSLALESTMDAAVFIVIGCIAFYIEGWVRYLKRRGASYFFVVIFRAAACALLLVDIALFGRVLWTMTGCLWEVL